jgi:hypothetical protein
MRRLLGRTSIPLVAMARPDLFRDIPVWWSEFPGATPARSLDGRWAHVDLTALGAAYDAVVTHAGHGPPGEPPALPVSDPCPACGVGPERHYRMDSRTCSGPVCGGCGWTRQLVEHWPNEDGTTQVNLREHALAAPGRAGERSERDVDAAVVLGLPLEAPSYGPDPLAGLAERVGFRYFAETGRQQPNERPWQHLDVERMRKRAARVPA